MTAQVGMAGYQPGVAIRPTERELYRQMWNTPGYRNYSPGERCAQEFLDVAKPRRGATVLDLGCGTGRGGLLLALIGGLDVTYVDFADNCLDDDIRPMLETQAHTMRFVEADLTKVLPVHAAYGFCTDVLEHIPPAQLDLVIEHCLRACQHVYFQISTADDAFGAVVGHKLHLSVHPQSWWAEKFAEHGAMIHYSTKKKHSCTFYMTGWKDAQELVDSGKLNVEEEATLANLRANLLGGWNHVSPHMTNGIEVAILGGGPSLNRFEDDIREKQKAGVKIVTLNGTYNWCVERGIFPVTQIMVDAREFNARFVRPVREDCMYLLSSQCHPSVLEGLPKDRTFLWHPTTKEAHEILKEHYGDTPWYPIPGGSTVLLRAIPLLRMLGFRQFHLYGCDSCLEDGAHHAYNQPENDGNWATPLVVQPSGRVFYCHAWMSSQAQEFISLIRQLGNEIELQVYGDGLLAYILEHGAQLSEEREFALAA